MWTSKISLVQFCLLAILTILSTGCQEPSTETKIISTPSVELAGLVPPRSGPRASETFTLSDKPPAPVWLTGAQVEIVSESGTLLSPDLLREAGVFLVNSQRHKELLGVETNSSSPLLLPFCPDTRKIQFPEGYGIPLKSNELLQVAVQWNSSDPYLKPSQVSLRLRLHFSRVPLSPLKVTALFAQAQIEGDSPYFKTDEPEPKKHGPGLFKSEEVLGRAFVTDEEGGKFSPYFWVPKAGAKTSTWVSWQLTDDQEVVTAVPFHPPQLRSVEVLSTTADTTLFEFSKSGSGAYGALNFNPPAKWLANQDYLLRANFSHESPVAKESWASVYLYSLDKEP